MTEVQSVRSKSTPKHDFRILTVSNVCMSQPAVLK